MIDAPTREELAQTAAAMAAGLAGDPGWQHVVPDDGARRLALRTLLGQALRIGHADGTTLVVREQGIVGGIVWAAPEGYPPRRIRQLPAMPRMLALATRIGPITVRELGRFGRAIDRAFPTDPVWYVQALSVAPAAQGRGLGSALLGPVLTKADATSTPCYLETAQEANVGFYERFAFRVLDAEPVYPGGPVLWRMRREPHTAT